MIRKDRTSLLIAGILLLLVCLACFLLPLFEPKGEGLSLSAEQADSLAALAEQVRIDSVERAERHRGSDFSHAFPFDPNHADSATLLKVGFSPWQIRNMMKYREKGGKWRSPDDFRRLYGLSEEDFQRLRPFVRIRPEDAASRSVVRWEEVADTFSSRKPRFEKTVKAEEGTVFDLNAADTLQLKMIPGIGSYYASKIVRYRERLGGFVSVSQIEEVEGLPANMGRWFKVESSAAPQQIHLNRADFRTLVRHPYMSYEQTKVIVNHIRKNGPIRSWKELSLYKEFTEADFRRLTPYFRFD